MSPAQTSPTMINSLAEPGNTQSETDWEASDLTQLVNHLLRHHHPYTKTALAELAPLLDKVVRMHGGQHPELRGLAKLFTELRDDMGAHLMKEENILFPYMLALETDAPSAAHFGTVANPIRMMTLEHEHDSLILHKMLEVTDRFTLPPDACNSFTLLYKGLHALVSDLFQHIALENDIVFPKAIATEKTVQAKA
ncbi:MAG: iron-sulfur cluster repair di-iron protein [Gallionellaceae bacterium]|nr:MAG: iron-sulfur cluster repair di-iron protein [Gallionellaceae bacterium]